MEVVRDKADNAIIICSIENVDPMGVHTGDSITVAPALTLTDKEYQRMRSASIAVLREIGVETAAPTVQFAVNPADGRMVIIEMNPRVSRSSALASKATGFPIAKIAAKLAVGYTLDELQTTSRRSRQARLRADHRLCRDEDPAFRLREIPRRGAGSDHVDEIRGRGDGHRPHLRGSRFRKRCARWRPASPASTKSISSMTRTRSAPRSAAPRRIVSAWRRRRCGSAIRRRDSGHHQIRPVVPGEMEAIVAVEARIRAEGLPADAAGLRKAQAARLFRRAAGEADRQTEKDVRALRTRLGVHPVFKRIDTCAAEFAALTPYMYSTYDARSAARPNARPSRATRRRSSSSAAAPTVSAGHRVRLLLLPRRLLAVGAGFRDHHGQLQPGDRLDRLRHLRPALFRAAHRRRRAGDRAQGEGERHARRGDRAVRRPDAAQARQHPGRGRRADPGHQCRRHRPRGRSQAIPDSAATAQSQAAAQRHRDDRRGDHRGGGRHRLPRDPAALLCARRARHGRRRR